MERTYTANESSKIAEEILQNLMALDEHATVLTLQGELGAGKTTLTQQIARSLGVGEQLVSPTFVIMKRYFTNDPRFRTLVHIDAYRIEDEAELVPLRFQEILQEPATLVIIEWPEKINRALPSQKKQYQITHAGVERIIKEIHV